MAVTAKRLVVVTYSGDIGGEQDIAATDNASSPGQIQLVTLSSGDNTINVPAGGTVPTAVTIMKSSDNTGPLIFKGSSGDDGVRLHNTDPDSISLHSSVTSFILNTAESNVIVRLVWS